MDDEVDLEDIESRLYSQVYHSTADDKINISYESRVNLNVRYKAHNYRYFVEEQGLNLPSFIPLEEETVSNSDKTSTPIHSSITFNNNVTDITTTTTTTEGNCGNRFQNNITVNQYTLPLIINPEQNNLLSPTYCNEKLFVPWAFKNKKLLDRKNRKQQKRLERRRQKNKEKRLQNSTSFEINRNTQKCINDIVCISDESDGECVIISDTCKRTQLDNIKTKTRLVLQNAQYDSSDDIIYIPPPPIEVIDVDGEETVENISGQNNSADCSKTSNHSINLHELSNSPKSCTSNDFLDNSAVENSASKFNFSLHGSDFNNTVDFVRPANPIDYCETESSCSTNDFNRENNTVKTIVFNEIDFPREDIFLEKNLEGFSTYITPKRKTCKELKNKTSKSQKLESKGLIYESSSSSSESDNDLTVVNKNIKITDAESPKKLPTLSPMQCNRTVASSTTLTNKKLALKPISNNVQTKLDKRKSNSLINSELDNDNVAEESNTVKKKLLRKKKKTSKKSSSEDSDKTILDTEVEVVTTDRNVSSSHSEESVGSCVSGVRSDTFKKIKKNSVEKINSNENILDNVDNTTHFNRANEEQINEVGKGTVTNILNISQKKKRKSISISKNNEIEITSNSSSAQTHVKKVGGKNRKRTSDNSVNSELNQNIDNTHRNIENQSPHNCTLDNNRKNCRPLGEIQNKESFTENLNEIITISSSLSPINVSGVINDEFVVVDEIGGELDDFSHILGPVEILISSDSECDFQELRDVGHDLELANCSIDANEVIDIDDSSDNFKSQYVLNTNVCEDPSEFDVAQIQSSQSDDPEVWKISARDRLTSLISNEKIGPRCNRCRHFGHTALKCLEKPDPPSCSLCGTSGHQEPRCPNKICTQCGNKGDYSTRYCWKCIKFRNSICRICNMKGHIAKSCPDLWRRYHLTTQKGPIVVSQEPQLKPRDQQWCSGCACLGHLEHECNYYNREYPPTNPRIASYEDVLNLDDNNRPPERTAATPPPPPAWNAPEQNIYVNPPSTSFANLPCSSQSVPYGNPPSTSFANLPCSSQSVPYGNPPFIPPLMSQIINLTSLFQSPTVLGQNAVIGLNSNVNDNSRFLSASSEVLNPFSVLAQQATNTNNHVALNQLLVNYINNGDSRKHLYYYNNSSPIQPHMVKDVVKQLLKSDQKKIKRVIFSMSNREIKRILSEELSELENVVSQSDPKYLKNKLTQYDKMIQNKNVLKCEVMKERCFWYHIFNMFIFGVHQFGDGQIHINFIKQCLLELTQKNFDLRKRKALLYAYNYIFEGDHRNIDYYKVLQQLIEKYQQ